MLFSLLPIPMVMAGWNASLVWGICSAAMGTWFIGANVLYLAGDAKDRAANKLVTVPVITPIFQVMMIVSFLMGAILWLSAFEVIVPRSQATYVFGLITLLVFAAVEFLFFIGVISKQQSDETG